MDCAHQHSFVYLDDQISGAQRFYQNPQRIIIAHNAHEVSAALADMENSRKQGLYLAGYIAYETGYALEPRLRPLLENIKRNRPLICMGVFDGFNAKDFQADNIAPGKTKPRQKNGADSDGVNLLPIWNAAEYKKRFNKVIDYIRAGDVYQINLTFPMRGHYAGSAQALYQNLRQRQPGHFGAVISLCGPDIISFSPELFFKIDDEQITLRPMKGTAARSINREEDKSRRAKMQTDEKSRAENLMIVDLLRNDVSRIAQKASVKVPALFSLETYPTLHQMTSTITAKLAKNAKISDIVSSLFPCGSVTGAPKIRAMEIIHELEGDARGAYCGAVGYFDPGGASCFSVAIRTASLKDEKLTYPVGSGIVLDSVAADEYAECLLKAQVLRPNALSAPKLIETFAFQPGLGPVRLDMHMARLARSAAALGYPFDERRAYDLLENIDAAATLRLRLVLSPNGKFKLTHTNFAPFTMPVKTALSKRPLSLDVQETRYKVSTRPFYDSEHDRLSKLTGSQEVLFFNPKGELCEGSFTSVFIRKNGDLLTPTLSCGLLPGVLRQSLLEKGEAREALLYLPDLLSADEIYIGNSLRGLMRANLTGDARL